LIKKTGKLAIIVEIIDQSRVCLHSLCLVHTNAACAQALIDGPSTGVERQAINYSQLYLTPLVATKLTRGARSPTVKKVWESSGVAEKWAASSWAQTIGRKSKKASLGDFDRFQVRRLKAQRAAALGKAVKKAKSA
jgi:large subunit ribosomal protein L14e